MIQLDSFNNNNNNSNNMQWFNAIAIGVLGIWSFSKLLKAKVQHLHRNPLEHPIIIHHPHYKATIAFTDIYTAFQNFIVWHMIISIILLSCNLQHYCIPSSSGVLFHDTTVSYHVLSMLYNPLYLVVPCRTRFIWTCSVGVSVGSVGVFVDFFWPRWWCLPTRRTRWHKSRSAQKSRKSHDDTTRTGHRGRHDKQVTTLQENNDVQRSTTRLVSFCSAVFWVRQHMEQFWCLWFTLVAHWSFTKHSQVCCFWSGTGRVHRTQPRTSGTGFWMSFLDPWVFWRSREALAEVISK